MIRPHAILLLLTGVALPAIAQTPATPRTAPPRPAPHVEADDEEIVVQGQKPPGSVVGDIPPEQVLTPADVRAYGVNSIADLLNELAPQTQSNRGRGGEAPAVLLNGRRISGFSEIRDVPTEAILRVEILPEEVALKYGFSADQKVVNIVLRRRFRAKTAVADGSTSTDGGGESGTIEGGMIRIQGDNRFNLNLRAQSSARLLESQRDLISIASGAGGIDLSPYRTLRPATDTLTLNSVYSRAFGGVSATINGMLTATQSKSLNGLPVSALVSLDPLGQRTRSTTAHLGAGLNGMVDAWRWTVTGNYDHGDNHTRTERDLNLTDRARSRTDTGDLQAIFNGKLATLPAGNLSTTIRVGGTFTSLDGRSVRSGLVQESDLSRRGANGQVNVDLPIASRRTGTLAALGNLTANANLAVNQLSDFGTLTTWGYGLNWTPRPPLSLIASVTHDQGAPTVQQLGNPVVVNPQARVFDYARGQTVDVTAVTGGNPNLLADNRRVFKAGATWKPLPKADLSLVANYVSSRIRNIISTLPEPTAGIEAAFPDRFLRDSNGDLVRIDTRAVNFARQDQESLRMGFTFSMPLKPSQATIDAFRRMAQARGFGLPGAPGAPGAGGNSPAGDAPPPPPAGEGGGPSGARPDGPPGGGFGGPPGGGGPGGGFGGRGPGGRGGGGRVQVALYHTWYFQDEVLIRPGLPVLDLLNGDATGSGGGQPRHEVEAQLGYSNNGLGVRLSGNWQSATSVRGGAASTVGDLRFSDLTTVDLRVFGDIGFMPAFIGKDWGRNLRLTFAVTNIFNERQRVRDVLGDTPVRYQPGYLDPLGRSVRIGIRKLFAPIPPRPVTRRQAG